MHFLLIERSIVVFIILNALYETSKIKYSAFTTLEIYLNTQRFMDQEVCMNIPSFNYACITFGGSMKVVNGKISEHIS